MHVKRLLSTVALAALLVTPALGQEQDKLMEALRLELTRSSQQLQQPGQPKPYFVQYDAQDAVVRDIQAQDGALVHSWVRHTRPLKVDVRVGSYDDDSRGTAGGREGYDRDSLVLDADVGALRHILWLTSDDAYRQALQAYALKKSQPKAKTPGTPPVADFSAAAPLTKVEPMTSLSVDNTKWENTLRHLTAVGTAFPQLMRVQGSAEFSVTTRYLLNSEGTAVRQSLPAATLSISVTCEQEDGSINSQALTFAAHGADQLPSEEEMLAKVREFCQSQVDWSKASSLKEDYLGPVLFTGGAATELFGEIVVPLIMPGSERLHKAVLPVSVTVRDEPSLTSIGGLTLMGTRSIDGEGVASQPVTLIEQGKVSQVLSSRKPTKNSKSSNGHGASSGGDGGVLPSNLIISSSEGKSFADLKSQLIQKCREEGLEYGIIVRLPGPANLGASERGLSPVYYKVSLDTGEEQMLRQVRRERLSLRGFRRLLGIGNDNAVANFVADWDSFSIVSPSLLLSELEVTASPERPTSTDRIVLPPPPPVKK